MKKLFSFILACTMFISVIPAFAESNDVEKVLASVKARIGSTEKFDEFDSNVYEENGKSQYSFYWYQSEGDYDSLSVTVNDEGLITNYYYYSGSRYYDEKPKIRKIDEAETYNKACEFAKQLNPDIYDEIKLTRSDYYDGISSDELSFKIIRCPNGIELANEMGSMSVSYDGQTLYNYSVSYDKSIAFDKPDGIISYDDAKKAYAEKIGMTLKYDYEYKNGEMTVFPVYIANDTYLKYIDAKTGELTNLYDVNYEFLYKEMASEDNAVATYAAKGDFTDVEIEELEGIKDLLTTSQVETIARKNKILSIPKSFKLTSVRGYSEDDKYIYNLYFFGSKNSENIVVSVDAKTGDVLYFSKNLKSGKGSIKQARAQKIADDAVKALIPQYYEEYSLDNIETHDNTFAYSRMVNGIPFTADNIYIEIDMTNGEIKWFSYSYNEDVTFPAIDNVISEQEAIDKLFEANDYKPYYVLCCSKDNMTAFDKATLVYKFGDDAIYQIDALSGKPKTYYSENEEYTDISGHYCENAVTELKKNNIGYSGKEFAPTKEITQKEFVAFAVSILKQSSSIIIDDEYDYSYVEQQAKRFGIIDDSYEPNSVVTREDAAVLLAKAMGFNEYAKLEDIFKCPFADVTKNIGQIAILSGLKIINGDGTGNFNPEKVLTRGDFAIILYNCLTK